MNFKMDQNDNLFVIRLLQCITLSIVTLYKAFHKHCSGAFEDNSLKTIISINSIDILAKLNFIVTPIILMGNKTLANVVKVQLS